MKRSIPSTRMKSLSWRTIALRTVALTVLCLMVSACPPTPQTQQNVLIYYREPFQFTVYDNQATGDPDPSHDPGVIIEPNGGAGPFSYFQIYCINNETDGKFTFDPSLVYMDISKQNYGGITCPNGHCPIGGMPSSPIPSLYIFIPGGWSNSYLGAQVYGLVFPHSAFAPTPATNNGLMGQFVRGA
jgi:hypothetical protein